MSTKEILKIALAVVLILVGFVTYFLLPISWESAKDIGLFASLVWAHYALYLVFPETRRLPLTLKQRLSLKRPENIASFIVVIILTSCWGVSLYLQS